MYMEIPVVSHCKYWGILIQEKNCDLDLRWQIRKFNANANILMRKIANCSPGIICYLFKTYCSNLYCSSLWFDSTKSSMKTLKIAYNNSLHRFLGISKYNSASQMLTNLTIPSFSELNRKYAFSFMHRVVSSINLPEYSTCL